MLYKNKELNEGYNRKTISRSRVLGAMAGIAAALTSVVPTIVSGAVVSSVLPTSRSVQVGDTATAFATIVNAGPGIATGCSISSVTTVPATFLYQTTDPATNALTGTPNTPVDIAEGATQSFIFAFTPTAPFAPIDVELSYDCTNTSPAASVSGLNTLLLSGSSTPVPDIIALATGTGVLELPVAGGGAGAFAVATVNFGATGTITASTNTGSATLPVTLSVCETNPSTGVCINPTSPAATATTPIAGGGTPTFAFFATATGTIPLDLANNRAFVSFKDSGGVTRGSTSVALSAPIPLIPVEPPPLTDGVFGSLIITGSSEVPGTFVPVDKVVGQGASLGSFKVIFNEIDNDAFFNSWVLDVNIFDAVLSSGAFITFGKFGAGAEYTCESGIVGNYGNCSGASFDDDTRTVRFSNVQLQAPGFGTVITLNGALKY